MNEVLKLYSTLLTIKNRTLSQETYAGIVELSLKNGCLQQASYFLCQMDRLKIVIPRKLLDLFLDYSLSHRIFERNREELIFDEENPSKSNLSGLANSKKVKWTNKFDEYSSSEPEFQCYYTSKLNFVDRFDEIKKECSKLCIEAKPFVPKKSKLDMSENEKSIEKKLRLNPNAKDYVPKNYRLIKASAFENNM